MIRTVTGDILPENLGITMAHEHLALNLASVRKDSDSTFDDRVLVIQEVMKMKALGVQSVIEVTCNDMGRDICALKELSQKCGIYVVAATGYYLEAYHPDYVRKASPEQLADIFMREVLEGIDGTGICAGVIGEVASGEKEIAPSERNVLIGAALAGKKLGCAVTTHCQLGKLALEQANLLISHGMNPQKIVLGHLDLANDRKYYEMVLNMGVNIGFDTIGKRTYLEDRYRADNLMWLIERGYENQIVLSQDISRKSYFSSAGSFSGYMAVMKDFVPLLKSRGIPAKTLNKLLVSNPARIFNILP